MRFWLRIVGLVGRLWERAGAGGIRVPIGSPTECGGEGTKEGLRCVESGTGDWAGEWGQTAVMNCRRIDCGRTMDKQGKHAALKRIDTRAHW